MNDDLDMKEENYVKPKMKMILALVLTLLMLLPMTISTAETAEESIYPDFDPIDPAVTLKVGYSRLAAFAWEGGETIDDNTWTNLYRQQGINLEVLYEVNEEAASEKLNQLIMSGDYPDVFAVSTSNFIDWVQQGILADITDVFEDLPEGAVKDYFDTELGQMAIAAASVDGRVYGIPFVSDPYDSMSVLWIRKDWLDKLGLEEPKTIQDVWDIAKAFTENDPDGNGVDDTYGLGINGSSVFHTVGGLDRLFKMFGVSPGDPYGSIPFVEYEGSAVWGGSLAEQMETGLQWLADMYEAGYIPKDFITAGVDQVRQDASTGRIGMYFGSMSGANNVWFNAIATQPDAEFIAVALPGETEEDRGQALYKTAPWSFYAMSSKCDSAEAFMRLLELNFWASPDNLSQDVYNMYNGNPGEYTGWQNNLMNITAPFKNLLALERQQAALAGDTSLLNVENWRDYEVIQQYFELKDRAYDTLTDEEIAAYKQGIFYYSVWGAEQCSYAAIQEMIDLDNFQYSAYNTVATENMNKYASTLETLTKETIINIILGNQSVESYEDFLDTWYAIGGQIIEDEADAWYQANAK